MVTTVHMHYGNSWRMQWYICILTLFTIQYPGKWCRIRRHCTLNTFGRFSLCTNELLASYTAAIDVILLHLSLYLYLWECQTPLPYLGHWVYSMCMCVLVGTSVTVLKCTGHICVSMANDTTSELNIECYTVSRSLRSQVYTHTRMCYSKHTVGTYFLSLWGCVHSAKRLGCQPGAFRGHHVNI